MLGDILLLMFSAVLLENFIFVKFMGICPFLGVSDKPEKAFGMGMAVTFVITISSVLTNAAYTFLLKPLELAYLNTIVFVLIIAALVQFIELFLKKYVPSLYSSLGIYLPLITTNCAVLGTALQNVQREYSIIESAAFGFSASIGFTMAIVVFAGVRGRMQNSEPPRAFKGMPITLIAAGLLAMAFSGFSGVSFG